MVAILVEYGAMFVVAIFEGMIGLGHSVKVINTMRADLTTVDDHLAALRSAAGIVQLRRR